MCSSSTEMEHLAILLHEVKMFATATPLFVMYDEFTLADVKMVFVDSLDQLVTTTIGRINATQPSGSRSLAGIESARFFSLTLT